jgi:hypothetical protein
VSEEKVDIILDLHLSELSMSDLRKVELVLTRVLSLLNRMGLQGQAAEVIAKLQQIIMTVRILHSALLALQRGTMFGNIIGLLSVATAGVSIYESFVGV